MSDIDTAYKLLSDFNASKWKRLSAMKQRLLANKLLEVRNMLVLGAGLMVKDDFEYLQLDKEAGVKAKGAGKNSQRL